MSFYATKSVILVRLAGSATMMLLSALTGSASTIVSTNLVTPGFFQPSGWTLDEGVTAGPFFDKKSYDDGGSSGTRGCSIGNYIAGGSSLPTSSPTCGNQPGMDRFASANYQGPAAGTGPGNGLQYWAQSSTVVDLGFYFMPDSPRYVVTIMAEAAGNANFTELWVYFRDGSTLPIQLAAGTDSPGKTVAFTPGLSNQGFGFYIVTRNGSKHYTESSLNTSAVNADQSGQHFAAFRGADVGGPASTGSNWQRLWIGAEDTPFSGIGAGDGDYNDVIFQIACQDCGTGRFNGPAGLVPEPGTSVLVGAGVILFPLLLRLRRKRLGGGA